MMQSILTKLVKGGEEPGRKTRFHDENNIMMPLSEFIYLPHTLLTTINRKLRGKLPLLPWWPYSAIRTIESLLRADFRVLEYGIGMSTLWLASRVHHVYGIEGSPEWYARLKERVKATGVKNVSLYLRDSTAFPNRGHHSADFNADFASLPPSGVGAYDLVIVDGAARWLCVKNALPALKPGGYLYLDNSDADKDWAHYTSANQRKEAQALLRNAVSEKLGTLQYFRGLSPATPAVSEGMLLRTKL